VVAVPAVAVPAAVVVEAARRSPLHPEAAVAAVPAVAEPAAPAARGFS
jgi:hypothetical protein